MLVDVNIRVRLVLSRKLCLEVLLLSDWCEKTGQYCTYGAYLECTVSKGECPKSLGHGVKPLESMAVAKAEWLKPVCEV
jgi:hypothetical protein